VTIREPRLSADFFRQRRDAFFERAGDNSLAIFEGIGAVNDNRIAQAGDFYYLTGLSEPNAVAVLLVTGGTRKFILFVEPRDPARERWVGVRAGLEGAVEQYGADDAHAFQDLEKELPSLFVAAQTLYISLHMNTRAGRKILEAFQLSAKSFGSTGRGVSRLHDPAWILADLRMRKTDEELALMRRASWITEESYLAALREIRPERCEYQVEAALDCGYRTRGADGAAYSTIVGSGSNATILHYNENSETIRDGDLVLIDSAASYGHYASDVTRTFPVNGTFTPEQRRVYEIVLRAQKRVIESVRPGETLKGLHKLGALTLIEGMAELGWLPNSPAETLFNEHAHRTYFMHGVGHYLGLEVHDAGHTEINGQPCPLEPGMVITVEPGLYVGPDADGAAEAYRGIGVRIEDPVVVTETGCEVLTSRIPKEPDEVEHALAKSVTRRKRRSTLRTSVA
jgi:Xaa-Pro aminopeptidase